MALENNFNKIMESNSSSQKQREESTNTSFKVKYQKPEIVKLTTSLIKGGSSAPLESDSGFLSS